jgi:hypothetical protein
MKEYPKVFDENKVGEYPALAKAGGGYVWDEVLEYRVWCHPEIGAKDLENGNDYFYTFKNYEDANEFYIENKGTEEPLALILQKEYIDEHEPGQFIHMKERRITEWPVQFLSRPRRDKNTLPNFFAPDAPSNRLDIIRGLKNGETFQKEEIFISEINERINRAIVIEGDEHTVWAYCMKLVDEEKELLFDGFICSRGTIVDKSEEVRNFISNDYQPPLMDEYKNDFSIHESITNEDFRIKWENDSIIKIFMNEILYLVMDLKSQQAYSKSIKKQGPYGKQIIEYENK